MTNWTARLCAAFIGLGMAASASAADGSEVGRASYDDARHYPASPDFAGTAAINAGVTIYDARFRRVAAADRNDPRVRAIAGQLAGLSDTEKLVMVKRLVEQRVRYASDLDTIKVSDYWSSAGDTLSRGAGDDEDIAIVEMQALKAAGFPADDLYISVGRHKIRGAHNVLIARTSAGFFLLDAAEPTVLSGRSANRFVPMLTMGTGRSWVHGYRRGRSNLAAR
nr:transglutaminase-like cysteine peptidase [uncultured Sphingomonas sp.]